MKFIALILSLFSILLVGCADYTVSNVEIQNNTTIPKGEGQFCEGDFNYGPCLDGLVCVIVSESPYELGKCYPEWAVDEEDFTPEAYDLKKEIEIMEENARNRG